jgi:shikimate kinase
LQRIVFYDDDSNRIENELDEGGRALYLREILKDISYFRRFHKNAQLYVDLSGAGVAESAEKVKAALDPFFSNDGHAREI